MAKKNGGKTYEETMASLGDESVDMPSDAAAEAEPEDKPRRTRTRKDPSQLDPLDASVWRLQKAHRIAKLGRDLDTETRTIAIRLLTDMG